MIIEILMVAHVKDDGVDAQRIAESIISCLHEVEGVDAVTAEVRGNRGRPPIVNHLELQDETTARSTELV